MHISLPRQQGMYRYFEKGIFQYSLKANELDESVQG